MDETIFADFDVTCHTEGCENAEIVIRVSATAEAPNVVCGPCGIKIEDVISLG